MVKPGAAAGSTPGSAARPHSRPSSPVSVNPHPPKPPFAPVSAPSRFVSGRQRERRRISTRPPDSGELSPRHLRPPGLRRASREHATNVCCGGIGEGVARPAGVTPAVGADGHRYGPRSRPGLLLLLREGAPISKSDRPCPKWSRTAPPERPATVAQCFRGGRKHSSSGDMDCGWRVGLIRFQICAKLDRVGDL